MSVKRYPVTITTATGGAGTGYTSGDVRGVIDSIQYVPHGTTPYANTVDVTITAEDTGTPILAVINVLAAFTYRPRAAGHDTSGAALLYAAGGTAVTVPIAVVGERVKIVLAQGGDAKVGTFYVTVLA